jgi:hypothetical protein
VVGVVVVGGVVGVVVGGVVGTLSGVVMVSRTASLGGMDKMPSSASTTTAPPCGKELSCVRGLFLCDR